jgi:hypothetical protein
MNKLQTFFCLFGKIYAILTPIFSSRKFGPFATLPVPPAHFFLCLFWAAGGYIDFLLEGILNL